MLKKVATYFDDYLTDPDKWIRRQLFCPLLAVFVASILVGLYTIFEFNFLNYFVVDAKASDLINDLKSDFVAMLSLIGGIGAIIFAFVVSKHGSFETKKFGLPGSYLVLFVSYIVSVLVLLTFGSLWENHPYLINFTLAGKYCFIIALGFALLMFYQLYRIMATDYLLKKFFRDIDNNGCTYYTGYVHIVNKFKEALLNCQWGDSVELYVLISKMKNPARINLINFIEGAITSESETILRENKADENAIYFQMKLNLIQLALVWNGNYVTMIHTFFKSRVTLFLNIKSDKLDFDPDTFEIIGFECLPQKRQILNFYQQTLDVFVVANANYIESIFFAPEEHITPENREIYSVVRNFYSTIRSDIEI